MGGYHRGGCSVPWGDIMINVGGYLDSRDGNFSFEFFLLPHCTLLTHGNHEKQHQARGFVVRTEFARSVGKN